MLQEAEGSGEGVSDTLRARDRRALIVLFISGFLAYQIHWIFAALGIWVITLSQLERFGVLDRWNASRVLGALLMLRTKRGQDTIEKVAKPRGFWRAYGEISLWTCAIVMIFITLFLILSFALALRYGVEKSDAPASQLIPFPGISPIIPFWWPAIAFVGALVIHEFAHALQARAHGMRVKSVGLLMLGPFPAGAFVEPQHDELLQAPRKERARLFAAAPATNLYAGFFAWIMIGLLATQLAVVNPGVHASGILEESAADGAGLQPWEIITEFNGVPVHSGEEMSTEIQKFLPGDEVELTVLGHPDENGTRVQRNITLTLGSHAEYLRSQNWTEEDIQNAGIDENKSFLGVSGMASGSIGIDTLFLPRVFDEGTTGYQKVVSLAIQPIVIIGIPIDHDGQIMDPHEMEYIAADGVVGDLFGTTIIMALITLMFWFIWWNVGLGIANLIPIIPFDGGHLFKDFLAVLVGTFHKFSKDPHPLKTEATVARISTFTSLFLFFGLMLLIVAQRL